MKATLLFLMLFLMLVACGGESNETPTTAPPTAGATSGASAAPALDPVALLETYDFAINGRDVDAALALFADDAVVKVRSGTFTGRDKIRAWLQGEADKNLRAQVVGQRTVQGDKITWRSSFTRDDLKNLGIAVAEADDEATVRDSKIRAFSSTLTPETAAKLETALAAQATPSQPTVSATAVISGTGVTPSRVITGTGATPEELKPTVDAYKQELGGQDNGGEPGSKPTGYRTIVWDGVPDDLAAPNDYPADFFNAPTAPRARGAILKTPGTSLQVSAKAGNPTNTPPRFGNINPSYPDIFKTYSAERLFSPLGSNIVDLEFFVPGTNIPAVVRGYGAVYTDVDTDHTAFEYFDAKGNSLGVFGTPISNNGLSFLGVVYDEPIIHRVRIEYGTVSLGPDDSAANDVAVMDDFIYGEPQAIAGAAVPTPSATETITATGTISPTGTVSPTGTITQTGFVQLGEALNRDKTAAATDQELTLGSLFAGAEYIPWATWAEKQGTTQQIFVSRYDQGKFEFAGGSLNIHQNVVAEKPSIDFAGPSRTIPWVAWYEPSPGFGNVKQVFASRFNKDTGLWTPAGKDRGGNEPSLNIHTNKNAEDPILVGASANPDNAPVPWVCWSEESAYHNTLAIFVSRGISDTTALGGFRWQPVGLNRGGTDQDPEPSLTVNFEHGDGDHCWIAFAGENDTVPWVVWAERSGATPSRVLVARAVPDSSPASGGFKWEPVPACPGPETTNCALNVNTAKAATDPFLTAGSLVAGQPTVPWVTWTEVGPSGKKQVFVDRLDPETRNRFLHVGGSLNVNQNAEAEGPSITFLGNVPYVAWNEEVGGVTRVFVRHLASDPQTGTWVLDTPQEGLAVNKTARAFYPIIRAAPEGKVVIIWREGDPEKEVSQVVVCESSKLTALFQRIMGLAAPLLQNKSCQ